MKSTSEFVSLGHPDKIADFVSCYLLDRYLERDPFTRFAVECQIKDSMVTLGGEVTSSYAMKNDEVRIHVADAVRSIGYTMDYLKRWGATNAIAADNLRVNCYIGRQSEDIAQGVDRSGWGDQGIYWGMATPSEATGFMPRDHYEACMLGREIFALASNDDPRIGLDIKTLVEMDGASMVRAIVAAPCASDDAQRDLAAFVRSNLGQLGYGGAELIVNGTGRFVAHGPVADCGTTGRKLAVDFYGGNCRIGGGSPWTKDGTKADVALNLYARKIALAQMRDLGGTVYVSISSCIGRREISVAVYGDRGNQLRAWTEARPADEIIDELNLRQPLYAERCRRGLFFDIA